MSMVSKARDCHVRVRYQQDMCCGLFLPECDTTAWKTTCSTWNGVGHQCVSDETLGASAHYRWIYGSMLTVAMRFSLPWCSALHWPRCRWSIILRSIPASRRISPSPPATTVGHGSSGYAQTHHTTRPEPIALARTQHVRTCRNQPTMKFVRALRAPRAPTGCLLPAVHRAQMTHARKSTGCCRLWRPLPGCGRAGWRQWAPERGCAAHMHGDL